MGAPREPETEALAFGSLIHTTFEAVTNQNLNDDVAVKLFLSELDRYGLPVEVSQKLRERGPGDLMVALNEFREILHQGKAEVNFGPEKISIEGVPVTGKIDHLIVDEAKKTIEIYDFKTAQYQKDDWHKSTKLYKYMLQLLFYKLLLIFLKSLM